MLDFQHIYLSKKERYTLSLLDREERLACDTDEKAVFQLIHLEFAKSLQIDSPSHGNPIFYQITPRGHDYLMYFHGVKSQRRLEWIRYIITTAIAVAALITAIVSIILQYL